MGKLNIHIPDEDQDWLEKQGEASGVVASLIADKRHEEEYNEFVRSKVRSAEKRGRSSKTAEEIFAEARRKYEKAQ